MILSELKHRNSSSKVWRTGNFSKFRSVFFISRNRTKQQNKPQTTQSQHDTTKQNSVKMRYIFAYDGSKASKKAVEKVCEFKSCLIRSSHPSFPTTFILQGVGLMHSDKDEAVVLTLVEKNMIEYEISDTRTHLDAGEIETAKKHLKELEDNFLSKQQGLKFSTATALVLDSRDGLLQEAKNLGADVLVVGSKGHSRLASLAIGSTSDYAVRNSHIPILVIPVE